MNTDLVVSAFRCPLADCRRPVMTVDRGLICSESHEVARQDGILIFATPDVGKYDPGYASRYAALWAYGYETLHSGLDEGLYRTVSSFIAEALADLAGTSPAPLMIDAGCGVGRVLGDCARLAPAGTVVGFDASPAMLAQASQVVLGDQLMEVDLPTYGYRALRIAPRAAKNVILAQGDVEDLPLSDGCADIALSVNIVDRLPHGPEKAFAECYRILRSGGTFIFTDPFNWILPWLWEKYPDSASVLRLLETTGFTIETWFDDLLYHELLDARGSRDEFRTLAVKAHKR